MKFLITGGNGYIGSHLVQLLLDRGHDIHALIYYGTDSKSLLDKGVNVFEGDVRDYESLERAAKGCDAVFHLASYVGIWASNPRVFEDVNVKGTQTVLNVCRNIGIRRILVSSSCGIFGPSKCGELVDEKRQISDKYWDDYERSKFKQVEVAMNYLDSGLEVLFVYPTRVFGPGVRSDGNSLTKIFEGVLDGSWKVMLGSGRNTGNYVYVEDVARGMMLVMEHGEPGEGYILGGYNFTYNFLFELLQYLSGQYLRLRKVPSSILRMMGRLCEIKASWTSKKPFITHHAAIKYTSDWKVSTMKIRQLGYEPTPLMEAMAQTLGVIRESD